ncbi:MAG: hypothetical protein ABJH06_01725 [Paraglaciecola sp.]|uniref:hypothetical protein n=1 Tax=Paraglaciecola sp. TaxID=1920173 RepID=UPI0032984BB6
MMKTQAFVILISCFVCFKISAIRVVSCDKQDANYIATKHTSGAFIQANEIEKVFPRGSLKYNEICEVRNELIMDGLAFTLYKPEGNEHKFISVYNGLDGSSKLYGPFK